MSPEISELSASGIKTFRDCPKQFWYEYLSDVPEPTEGKVEHFEIGNAVHESIEAVLQTDGLKEMDSEELLDVLYSRESELEYEYDDRKKAETCLKTASRWIASFVKEVKLVEEKWKMERDGLVFKGIADLVADVDMGESLYEDCIVDWKTGQLYDSQEDPEKAKTQMWKEKIQGGMYAEMFHEKHGRYPDAILFVYLNEEEQSTHARMQNGEVFWNEFENKYWTEIEKYKNRILQAKNDDEWEARPQQSRCYFCPYKFHCRDSGVGAEDASPTEIFIGDRVKPF